MASVAAQAPLDLPALVPQHAPLLCVFSSHRCSVLRGGGCVSSGFVSVFHFNKAILVGVSWFFMVLICFSSTTNWCQTSHGLVDCVLPLEKTTQSFCPFFFLN